jgi:large subunit ribosomal protein L12
MNMEYIYAAMLLHKTGKKIDEASVTKVLEAAGVKVDNARVKALVAALDGVDITKAIEKQAIAMAPVAAAPAEAKHDKKEEKKKEDDEKKSSEQAAAGLGALFG